MKQQPKYYYGLDLLRFSSAMMVVLFHLSYAYFQPDGRGYNYSHGLKQAHLGPAMEWGQVGVQVFFVISGFVIANSANGSSAFRFAKSRVERLYPAVWICAPLSLLSWYLLGVSDFANLAKSGASTMTLFPFSTFGGWVDAPYWTLSHEIIFYGIVLILLLVGMIRRLDLFAAIITFVSFVWWAAKVCRAAEVQSPLSLSFVESDLLKMFLTEYGAFFSLGLFIWLLSKTGPSLFYIVGACSAFAIGLATFVIEAIETGRSNTLEATVWVASMAILFVAVRVPMDRRDDVKLLNSIRTLGLATYPLYLIHYAPGLFLMNSLAQLGVQGGAALLVVVSTLVVVSCLIASALEPAIRLRLHSMFGYLTAIQPKPAIMQFLEAPTTPITGVARSKQEPIAATLP